jgi:uncharacterized membrane protein
MKSYLLLGIITTLCGLILLIFPPKKRNAIYGFRSKRSFNSQESWDFANRYSAKLMIGLGLISTAIGAVTFMLSWSKWIPMIAGTLLLFVVFVLTEERLRKKRFR